MPEHFSFKSYSWSLGTTSFRMADFHRKVEEQIMLLDEFWNSDDNADNMWSGNSSMQVKYYEFLYSKGFVQGEIQDDYAKKAKTARQKTSGLVDVGLIDDNRRLTEVGHKLKELCDAGVFTSDNNFRIPSDSYLYFKQLLKTANTLTDGYVRPYLVTGIVLEACEDYLTDDEFTYLLPLCINKEITSLVINFIHQYRANTITIDEIIKRIVLSKHSYPAALTYFLSSAKTPEDIMAIGINRDSPDNDRCYVGLYNQLKRVFVDKDHSDIFKLYDAAKSGTLQKNSPGRMWRKLLFTNPRARKTFSDLRVNEFHSVKNETEFDKLFFEYLHLIKIKANLTDYKDLNRRYMNITDSFIFKDGKVAFTPLFRYFFRTGARAVFDDAYSNCTLLTRDCLITDINHQLVFNEKEIIDVFNKENDKKFKTIQAVYDYLDEDRKRRFRELVDTKFTNSVIISMLDNFETREHDSEIKQQVGSDADVPTIFEYIVAVAWYRISEYRGNVLDYMNLSLDANLLPRTHAGGGMSDIVYKYDATTEYPQHDLLIECTLMESTTQRHGEMEPVSRHLLNYMLDVNDNAYCTFVSNNLHPMVISDFRGRKKMPMYRNDTEYVDGMKIIPLHTNELKTILSNSLTYSTLYKMFDDAYNDNERMAPPKWYEERIKNIINLV